MLEGLTGMAIFLTIAFMRVPLAFAMALVGFGGFAYKTNLAGASSMIAQVFYETGFQYTLAVIPLFVLMGSFIVRARITEELFDAAFAFFGHLKGGLAISTLAACAGFEAVCGSSVATSATFTKVAFSPMIRFNYRGGLRRGDDCRRRNAGHHDSALGDHDSLRCHDGEQHRQAVCRRRYSRARRSCADVHDRRCS